MKTITREVQLWGAWVALVLWAVCAASALTQLGTGARRVGADSAHCVCRR